MTEPTKISIEIVTVLIAACGGFAKYLHAHILGEPFVLAFMLANITVSGFSGFMFAQFGLAMGVSEKMLYVLAGVGGFMGAASIELIRTWILRKLHLDDPYNKKPK